MTAPTPAVRRLAIELERRVWEVDLYDNIARDGLTAALNDPDDPDSLARTLYVIHVGLAGWTAAEALVMWNQPPECTDDVRVHWRAVADGLRMMLTGTGS